MLQKLVPQAPDSWKDLGAMTDSREPIWIRQVLQCLQLDMQDTWMVHHWWTKQVRFKSSLECSKAIWQATKSMRNYLRTSREFSLKTWKTSRWRFPSLDMEVTAKERRLKTCMRRTIETLLSKLLATSASSKLAHRATSQSREIVTLIKGVKS